VPYAFSSLHADGQAAEYYTSAIQSFDSESQLIDRSIEEIRAGKLLDRLLGEDKDQAVSWVWQLKNLPDAPESRYLYQLLAGNEFQEGLKNYRELAIMSHNLDAWQDSVAAFKDMIATRERAYALRVPKADAVLAATDVDRLSQTRMDFESRINAIEESREVAALGTPEEQETWARLKRIEDFLASHPDDPDLAEMREKLRMMKGVVFWRLSESFKARVWNERRSVKELEAELVETRKRAVLVRQARESIPIDTGGYAARVAAVQRRMDDLKVRLAAAAGRQNLHLQSLAIEELEGQKRRIGTYQVQARFALASIYDRTISEKAKPQAPKGDAPNAGAPPDDSPKDDTPNGAPKGTP
jgi:hypothetical protein